MQKVFRTVLIIFLALVLTIGPASPALALDAEEMRTVRVAFYHTEGYHVMDETGARSGYGYEIMQAMKLYTNWTYEYVGYDKGWADIQQMILDGEVDMAVSAVKTPAREEIYDFSDRPIGQSGACLMVRAGDSPYVAGQYDGYDGMRIGFIENASHIASTVAFAEEKGFAYTPVYYKTSAELESAILSGTEVDAIVTSNMRIVSGTRRLELYAMQDVHVMVQKGNRALLDEINYALEQISLYNPNLYETLFNKYYSIDMGDAVFFSPDERDYIRQLQAAGTVLQVALVPDMSPYAYYGEDDVPAGILYDIAAEILRRTGLTSELNVTHSDAEYRQLIENGNVDLRLAARLDYNYAEKHGYSLTSPYYSTDISRVTRKGDDGAIRSIATVESGTIERFYLPTILQGETLHYYGSVSECIDAVLDGSCDALYLFTRAAQEAVFLDETNRLTSVIMPRSGVSFCIGVRDGADARLSSILEKATVSLSEDDVSAFVLKYTDYAEPPMTLIGLLYNNPLFILAIVALLLIVVFAGILLLFIMRQRKLERAKNVQLQDALALAKQANSAKSVFMSRMSHEIRTPLNAIIGYNTISSSKLADAKTESELRQAAMKAMDCLSKSDIASKHLLMVINDVLDMSAIESGKIKIAREPFDFKSMISALTAMFFSQSKSHEIDFEVVFTSDVDEWYIGDPMRINQILTNLLSNAVKFTPPGGSIRLTINQEEGAEGKTRMRFVVADTGIGMSKAFLSSIWTPFEQADASISRRFGGTGLGLSITKNLVDLMGGAIRVESELDAGSTFFVTLPIVCMEQPVQTHTQDYSDVSVLVADDDISTCDYMKLLFNRAGTKCTTVTSGQAAIAAVAESIRIDCRYTACIIDWHMPGTDGMDTVRQIRKIAGPDLPIIIISAYDLSEIEDSARDAGVHSFVSKPLFQPVVFDLLATISGKRSAITATRTENPDFAGARVLLAEDNKMNMEIAKAILTYWNLQVDEARDGREAVSLFCSAPVGTYKAILMDVHMPEMDGYRATQTIRASGHAEAGSIPIIAMTADVFAEDVAAALAAGMNGHIGKPIDRDALLDTLRKYIDA